jgi:hypothetical protein
MRTRRGAVQANAAPQSKREQRLLSSLSTYGAYHAVQANAAPQFKREQRLLSSLSTYGAYHASPWNKIVHIVFVPAIWWCATLRAMLAGLFASRTRRQRRSAALALQATGPLEGAVGYAAARARGTKPCDG